MRVAMAQINPTVGALRENSRIIVQNIERAIEEKADIIVFPEMAVTGYPTYDLLYEEGFVAENIAVLEEEIAPAAKGIVAVVGFIDIPDTDRLDEEGTPWRGNCAAVISGGKIVRKVWKTLLPGYDVFDEKRYFRPGAVDDISPVDVEVAGKTIKLGVEICEDMWTEHYGYDVAGRLAEQGADIVVNLSASPFFIGKNRKREELALAGVNRHGMPLVYVNMVGGQDELVFDGRSFAMGASGTVAARGAAFEEDIAYVEFDENGHAPATDLEDDLPVEEEIIRAHVLNLRDYIKKQGVFDGIVVGSSGGADSAYTVYIAARAVGPENVMSVSMPSRFSSDHSRSDAQKLAENLGVEHHIMPIEKIFRAGLETFEDEFGKTEFSVAEENDQARCRMQILMKISMKYKKLVCTTGNKSELSVGYWTLYGDGAGGKNVPGDLFKTELYDVARYINRDREIIPWNIIDKPPSAELAPDQKDTDSLPEYDELDPILRLLVEERRNPEEIIRKGHDPETVKRIVRMYKIAEFKRGQMPQGIKIKRKSFGYGRRMPITNKWL